MKRIEALALSVFRYMSIVLFCVVATPSGQGVAQSVATLTQPNVQEAPTIVGASSVTDSPSLGTRSVSRHTNVVIPGTTAATTFKPGSIIINRQGRGFMGRVVSVSVRDGNTVVQTVPASLVEVYRQASIKLKRPLSQVDFATIKPLLRGVTVVTNPHPAGGKRGIVARGITNLPGITFNFNAVQLPLEPTINGSSASTYLTVNGDVSVAPAIDLNLQIRPAFPLPKVTYARFVPQLTATSHVTLTGGASASADLASMTYPFADLVGEPIWIPMGLAPPLVVVPALTVSLTVGVTAQGDFEFRTTTSLALQAGLEYREDSGVSTVFNLQPSITPSFSSSASVSLDFTPVHADMQLYLYGLIGPHLSLDLPRFEITPVDHGSPCVDIEPFLNGDVGLKAIPISGIEREIHINFAHQSLKQYYFREFCFPFGGGTTGGGTTGGGTTGGGTTGGGTTGGPSDTTLPTAIMDQPYINGLWQRGIIRVFGWAADASGVRQVQLLLDGQDMGDTHYPSPRDDGNRGWYVDWDTTSASTGNHTLLLRVTDTAGNVKLVSRSVQVDNIAPTSTATLGGTIGSNGWRVSDVTATLTVSDNPNGSGADRIFYALNDSPWDVYTAPISITRENANNVLRWKAIDNAGNQEAEHSVIIPIDKTAPTTTISLSGTVGHHGWWRSKVQAALSATDNPDGSGVQGIQWRINGGPWMPYTVPIMIDKEDANNVLDYMATDVAGNVETMHTIKVPIDWTPPTTAATATGSRDMGGLFRSAARINLVTTDNVSGKDYVAYSLNGQPEQQLAGGQQAFTISGNGASRFAYYSVDQAGNVETPLDSGPLVLYCYAVFAGGGGTSPSLRIMSTSNGVFSGPVYSGDAILLKQNTGLSFLGPVTTVSPTNTITQNTTINFSSPITTTTPVGMLNYPLTFYKSIAAVVFPAPLYLDSTITKLQDIIYVQGPVYISSAIVNGTVSIVAEGPISVTGTIQTLQAADQYNGVMLLSGSDINFLSTITNGVGLIFAPTGVVRIGSTNLTLNGSLMGREVEISKATTLQVTYAAGFPESTYPLPLTSRFLSLPQGAMPALPAPPTLIGPANQDGVRLTSNLAWNAVPQAVGYEFQLANESTFSAQPLVLDACTLSTNFSVNLTPNTKYWWRCRSVNRAGVGAWSNVAPFSTNAVVTPPPTALTATITGLTPGSGSPNTIITITGANLQGVTAVKFNGITATFWGNSATQVIAQVPAGATTGPLQVTATNGTVAAPTNFVVPPKIDSYTPSTGKSGASVTITGSGFTGATSVLFNGKAATFTVNSSTQIAVVVPANATTGPLSVTTPSGTVVAPGQFWVM